MKPRLLKALPILALSLVLFASWTKEPEKILFEYKISGNSVILLKEDNGRGISIEVNHNNEHGLSVRKDVLKLNHPPKSFKWEASQSETRNYVKTEHHLFKIELQNKKLSFIDVDQEYHRFKAEGIFEGEISFKDREVVYPMSGSYCDTLYIKHDNKKQSQEMANYLIVYKLYKYLSENTYEAVKTIN